MIGVDTNILLRYVLEDDPAQAQKAKQLLEEAVAKGNSIFVNRIVLCEMVWVLHQSYRLPKPTIATIIETLLEAEGFVIDAEKEAREALEAYRRLNLNFPDAFIAAKNLRAGAAHTFTFDVKAPKLPGFRKLK